MGVVIVTPSAQELNTARTDTEAGESPNYFYYFLIKGYICNIFDDLVYLSTEMKGYVTKKVVETVETVTLTPTASNHLPGERRPFRGRQFAAAPWPVLKREELNVNAHPLNRI